MQILVVEDDQGISSFLAKGLGAEGYRTIVAGTADEAGALLGAMSTDIDLVLLDLGLPVRGRPGPAPTAAARRSGRARHHSDGPGRGGRQGGRAQRRRQ